ncbi:hypothetical protein GW17_00000445, partial [Ensete ventricosum]
REGLRSCSLHLRTLWSDHASAMSLNKHFPSASRGFSQMSVANEQGRLRRKYLVRMDIGSNNDLSMRSCSDRHDGVFRRAADEHIHKAHVVGPHRHLVNGSKMALSEDVGLNLVNGDGSCKHGNPLEFPGHLKSEKLAVAVDVDEGIYLKYGSVLELKVSGRHSSFCHFNSTSLGAHVLIDDNPKYALECAEVGIRVLLFDYHNSYPWCKAGSATSHPMVTKVHNWQEVEQHLFSWIPT